MELRLKTADTARRRTVTARVRPRIIGGTEDPYARASIAIYGLNREGLVKDRLLKTKDLQIVCAFVVKLLVAVGEARGMTPSQEQQLKDYKRSLLTHLPSPIAEFGHGTSILVTFLSGAAYAQRSVA